MSAQLRLRLLPNRHGPITDSSGQCRRSGGVGPATAHLSGELRPGIALQEVPLAASLGVSRNTMREAMRICPWKVCWKRSIHRGVAVAQLSLKDVQEIYHLPQDAGNTLGSWLPNRSPEDLGGSSTDRSRATNAPCGRRAIG